MSKHSFLNKGCSMLFLGAIIPFSMYYYARKIEPSLLSVNKHSITSHKINQDFDHFKIVHFSDTHIGFQYSLQQLEELVHKINGEKPDMVCFTGDLIDNPDTFHGFDDVSKVLSTLQAPYGKFWVYGNHDHGGYGTESIKDTMEAAQFTLLQNQSTIIWKNDSVLQIAGLDDAILGNPNIDQTLEGMDPQTFTCLLVHEPDIADVVQNYPVDVQLSGHSHGGQVRLPLFGPLITPKFAHKYVDGEHSLSNGDMKLFVSRGIGTTRLPFRFFCKPEMNIYTLYQTPYHH